MKRTKLQKILNKLNGGDNFTLFDKKVAELKEQLKEKINLSTLEDVSLELNKFKKNIDLTPLLSSIDNIKSDFTSKISELSNEIDELNGNFGDNSKQTKKDINLAKENIEEKARSIKYEIDYLKSELVSIVNKKNEELDFIKEEINNSEIYSKRLDKNIEEVRGELIANIDKTLEKVDEVKSQLEKELKESIIDIISKIPQGGGSPNRKLTISGTVISKKYTDVNYIGSSLTITAADDDTNKRVNLTLTGGASGVSSVFTRTGDVVALVGDYSAFYQPLDTTLTSLAAYNTNGLLTQTAADTFTGRTITGTSQQIFVTNGDGVAGNPTLSFPVFLNLPGSLGGGSNYTFASTASMQLLGSTNTGFNIRTNAPTSSTNLSANVSYFGFLVPQSDFTESGSGTHILIGSVGIRAPAITNGAGATTNAVTLYVEGAPTGTASPTNSYAAWFDAGEVRIDGDIGDTTNRVTKGWFTDIAITNPLPIASGGTNNTTFTSGYVPYFDGTKLTNSFLYTNGGFQFNIGGTNFPNNEALRIVKTIDGSSGTYEAALQVVSTYNPLNHEGTYFGSGSFYAVIKDGNKNNTTYVGMRALSTSLYNLGTGNLTQTAASYMVTLQLAASTISESNGLFVDFPVVSAGAITTAIGVHVEGQKISGVTTGYGLYIKGAADYNWIEGKLGIGTTAVPTARLQVDTGAGGVAEDGFYLNNSGNAGQTIFKINSNYGDGQATMVDIHNATGNAFLIDGNRKIEIGVNISKYKNIATVGWGVPAIYGTGSVTGQTARSSAIATYTAGAADGDFEVSGQVTVSASTTHSFSLDVTYTDAETNTARTLVLPLAQLAGTFVTTGLVTNVTGVGPYESPVMHIRVKASTAITIRPSNGTFTSVTYGASATIRQLA